MMLSSCIIFFFFFNDTATTEIYTLSLHDALPICKLAMRWPPMSTFAPRATASLTWSVTISSCLALFSGPMSFCCSPSDRKSTRLNSSHDQISYAVFCLKKKKIQTSHHELPYCLVL